MDFNDVYYKILNVSPGEYNIHIRRRIQFTWDETSYLIRRNDAVVEIGIGPISILAKCIKKAKVVGINLDNHPLSLCNEFRIDLRLCDIQTSPLPLKESSVDVIFLLEVIEHLCMYPNDLFNEIIKKLKRGGYLIVSTVNFLRFSNRLRVFWGKTPLINPFEKTNIGKNHIREFIPKEMIYYLEKSGFRIIKKELFGIPSGNFISKNLLKLIYSYPNFRNYFLIIAQKK